MNYSLSINRWPDLDTYVLVSFGSWEDDGQDADELEDGSQEQTVAQHALQERGLGNLRRGQVQVCRHDGHWQICFYTNPEQKQGHEDQ